MKTENEEFKFCPTCGSKLQEVTGMTIKHLNNGGLNEISYKLRIAEMTLTKAGIEVGGERIAEMTLEKVDKILSRRLSEEEIVDYEKEIDRLREDKSDLIRRLERTEDQLKETQAKQRYVPSLKGANTEVELATRLRAIAPYDNISLKQRHQGSTDILIEVKSDETIIAGKIAIESKDVDSWKDEYVREAKQHGKKEGIENIILATTVMPQDALNNNLDCFRDNVWIVPMGLVEFAYASYRKMLIELYKAQKKFNNEIEAMEQENKVVDKLRDIINTDVFKKYSDIARNLSIQAESI